MKKFFILLCVSCLCHIVATKSDVRLPPTITRWQHGQKLLHNRGNQLTLECGAVGTPAVRYEWKKNGFELNTNLSSFRKGSDGTITINKATEMDEGNYQCFATNKYGTALSDAVDVRMIFSEGTVDHSTVYQKTVVEGTPFHIQAHRHRSYPEPLYDWYTAADINAPYYAKLRPSGRIQVADNGDLHFAYALPVDAPGSEKRIYRCTTFYPDSPWLSRQSHSQLTVTTRNSTDSISPFAPTFAFSSAALTVALVGESIKLRCFFYGYPQPTISWIGPTTGRYSVSDFNTILNFSGITASDEGSYSCTATNTQGASTRTFQIRVRAKPKFQNKMDGPFDVNVTEGDSVTFNCNASAKPQAKIVWLQNGQPIDSDNPPERCVFTSDKKSLTIRDVCRDCVDGERKTDLTVIQCNASNAHGYVFASGYLNVLLKTKVTIRGSKSESVDFREEKQFVFQCHVTSDPSRPATVRWYKTEPFGDIVRDEPPYVYVTRNLLIIMIDPKCSTDCSKYLGEYKCVGDDGYHLENRTITLPYQYGASADDLVNKEKMWATWKIILAAGAFGFVLLFIGIVLGFRLNRRFGTINRRSKDRKLPSLPLEATRNTGESMRRECSTYDRIGYETIDQVLEDVARGEAAIPIPPDSHRRNRYESSIEASQKETRDEGSECDAIGYLKTLDVVINGEKMDQNQVKGHESVTGETETFPKSKYQSESTNSNSYLSRPKVNFNLDVGKSDAKPKKPNSYLALVSGEGNPFFDRSSKEVNPYMKMVSKEVDTKLDLDKKTLDPSLKMDSEEVDDYLDMNLKEVNPCLNVGPKEVELRMVMTPKEMNPYVNSGSKKVSSYLDMDP